MRYETCAIFVSVQFTPVDGPVRDGVPHARAAGDAQLVGDSIARIYALAALPCRVCL